MVIAFGSAPLWDGCDATDRVAGEKYVLSLCSEAILIVCLSGYNIKSGLERGL